MSWIKSRIAAKSTTAGTPVKSCIRTRLGLKDISVFELLFFTQLAIEATALSILSPLLLRKTFSNITRKHRGR